MDKALKALYRELGYTGPLPDAKRRGGPREKPEASRDLPPLDEERLSHLEKLLKDEPDDFLALFRENYVDQYPLTDEQIRSTMAEARAAFDDPAAFLEKLRAEREKIARERKRGIGRRKTKIPGELILYPEIKIDPDSHKFEPIGDALGWVFNTGCQFVSERLEKSSFEEPFSFHHAFASDFKYAIKDKQGNPADPEQKISFALFGDFGTGLDHSLYIAKNIAAFEPDYAIHLGDVYYAGRAPEYEEYFNEPLQPVIKSRRVFAMNGNHEMFSGGVPYFANIYKRRTPRRGWMAQEQEGSYFCIWSPKLQIIGIDTAYHEDGRHHVQPLNAWLGQRLREGKSASPKRANILLSPNEPYKLGTNGFTPLYHDLEEFIQEKLIDFWFWGNTHYCALFDKSEKTPFIGSCIGHAGHPIYKHHVESNNFKHQELQQKHKDMPPAIWVDLSTKFPEHTGIRPDLANHGFCMLELEGDTIRLTYYDWLKKVQKSVRFIHHSAAQEWIVENIK